MSTGRAAVERRGLLWSPTVRVVNQLLHLSAAGLLVGSAIFMRLIMIPRLEATGAAASIPGVVDRFYSIFPWIALGVFLTTGLLNYLFWLAGTPYSAKESLRTPYVKVLLVKVALANVLLGLAVLFGFIRGMQENAEDWLWVLIALGVVITLISAALRRAPGRWHREAPAGPAGPAA